MKSTDDGSPNGSLDTRKHLKFSKNFSDYAAEYGFTDRAIRRWVRIGKQLGDIPPLDTPGEMSGWWARCMKHRVPDALLRFAAPNAPPPFAAPATAGAPPPDTQPRDFSEVQGLGIAENVEGLRKTHAINKKLLDEALTGTNDTMIALRQKNFERSFELLRKAEQTLIEIQKQRGNLIDREAVRQELAQLFESLRLMRETMPRRIIIELERLLPARFRRFLALFVEPLTAAIGKTRLDEEAIFRNLAAIDDPAEMQTRLLAA